MKEFERLLKPNIIWIAIGFFAATVVSNYIIWEMQKRQWKRDESIECLDELSVIIADRLYKAQRVYWGVEYNIETEERWKDYLTSVINYNMQREKLFFKILKLVNVKAAQEFFHDELTTQPSPDSTDINADKICLHEAIRISHDVLLCYYQCKKSITPSSGKCHCTSPTKSNDPVLLTYDKEPYTAKEVISTIEYVFDIGHAYLNKLNTEIYNDVYRPWYTFILDHSEKNNSIFVQSH